ncbi:MAG: hypothetical protein AAFW47_07200 [Pseudomonadota bacterium]
MGVCFRISGDRDEVRALGVYYEVYCKHPSLSKPEPIYDGFFDNVDDALTKMAEVTAQHADCSFYVIERSTRVIDTEAKTHLTDQNQPVLFRRPDFAGMQMRLSADRAALAARNPISLQSPDTPPSV